MTSAVVSVSVEDQADGRVLVRWEVEGDPIGVDIAMGSTPDHVDHRHELTVGAEQTSALLDRPDGGRCFVSVAPHGTGPAVVGADRRVPFEGVTNFRDLGGYPSRSGGTVRWGLVFRADALHNFSSTDLALYDRLGLRAVYDLRSDVERSEHPNPVASRSLIITGRPVDAPPSEGLPAEMNLVDGEEILRNLYVGVIDHAAVRVGELFGALTDDGGLPAVFHCHAGKDRTGIVAALLLEVLGVPRDLILDDYELTARYRLRTHQESTYQRLLDYGLPPEAAAGVLTAPRWAMREALEHLDDRYQGIDAYLSGPAGLEPKRIDTLRELLLAPGRGVEPGAASPDRPLGVG